MKVSKLGRVNAFVNVTLLKGTSFFKMKKTEARRCFLGEHVIRGKPRSKRKA